MDAKATGRLIAECRKEQDLSQIELAERIHVTDKAISRWETGRGMPSIDSLSPLADALGISVSELLSGRRLTAEELPKEAGEQIMQHMKRNARMLWSGVLGGLLAVLLAAGAYIGWHYVTTVDEADLEGLTRQAAEYLLRPTRHLMPEANPETLRIVEIERRGDYLAALCVDDENHWCMCVYDRDKVFSNRWSGGGGKAQMKAGALGSWNYRSPQREAVIIFCGGDLPADAAYYTFRNSGIMYTCPIEDGQVLDVFLLPDTRDISSYPETLLDAEMQPLGD